MPKKPQPKSDYPWSEKPPEFDATGRRIRDEERFSAFDLKKDYRPKPFSEDEIRRKLQERQVRLASATNTAPQAQASQKPGVMVPAGKPLDSKYRPKILKGVDNKVVTTEVIENEASKPCLYKDSAAGGGRVTVGAGFMISDVAEAKKILLRLVKGIT